MYSVLVVDDNISDRKGIIKNVELERLNLTICGEASNGNEGYKKALELKPDIIITDISMPLLNGIKMTSQLKPLLPKTSFIFMTCFDEFEFAKSAVNLNIDAYILKPIKIAELNLQLENIVEQKKINDKNKREYMLSQERLNHAKPVLKEQFIKDIFYGNLTEQEISEKLEFFDIKFNIYICASVKIYDTNLDCVGIESIYKTVCAIKDIFEKNDGVYCAMLSDKQLCLLVTGNQDQKEKFFDDTVSYLSNCRDRINKMLKTELTIGVANVSEQIDDLSKGFFMAEEATDSRFFSGNNSIIIANNIFDKKLSPSIDIEQIKTSLRRTLFETLDVDEFIKYYFPQNSNISEDYFKRLSFSILNSMYDLLNENSNCLKDIWGDDTILYTQISHFETILDIRKFFYNVLNSILQHISNVENRRYAKIAAQIMDIINNEYSTIENVEQISNKIALSAGHANCIFKQVTKKTIFDALLNKRIEVSKKLLNEPHYKIYEIVELVGYKSSAYFTTAFKEHVGMTPKEYRAQKTLR